MTFQIPVGRCNYWAMGDWWWARSYTDGLETFSSLAVWQDTCHTYKNPVYDLAHHQSPIAQWLERPTGILEGHGFDSRWRLRNSFFWVFRLENTSPLFTLYPSHQSIYQSFDYLLMITMQFNSNFQNSVTTFCTQYNVSALFGFNWRVLSQSTCWNLCMFIINTRSIQCTSKGSLVNFPCHVLDMICPGKIRRYQNSKKFKTSNIVHTMIKTWYS